MHVCSDSDITDSSMSTSVPPTTHWYQCDKTVLSLPEITHTHSHVNKRSAILSAEFQNWLPSSSWAGIWMEMKYWTLRICHPPSGMWGHFLFPLGWDASVLLMMGEPLPVAWRKDGRISGLKRSWQIFLGGKRLRISDWISFCLSVKLIQRCDSSHIWLTFGNQGWWENPTSVCYCNAPVCQMCQQFMTFLHTDLHIQLTTNWKQFKERPVFF